MSIFINEGKLWESDKIRKIFDISNHLHKMQLVEVAIAKAEADLGMIPKEAAEVIENQSSIEHIDLELYEKALATTGGHPVVAFLRSWKPALNEHDAFEFLHFGTTTQDIMDSATILLLKECIEIIEDELNQLMEISAEKAREHKYSVMAGRTHVQHAVPITFGVKWAIWLTELIRHKERIQQLKERLYYASFYGASGNLASFRGEGLKVSEKVAQYLDLKYTPVSWHTARDTMVEYVNTLANLSTTIGKIANELHEISRTEINEVEEPWTHGNVGSSTMPQKRNAFGIEAMVALSRICQSQASSVYGANMHEHERDFKAFNLEEYPILMVTHATEKIMHYGIRIFKDLVVNVEKMKENLMVTNGLIMSESLMMNLAGAFGKAQAHEMIYEHAMEAYKNNRSLKECIMEDEVIVGKIDESSIDRALDPINYIGSSVEIIDAAIKQYECAKEKTE